MKPVLAVRATLLSVAISMTIAGCSGGNSEEMSQEEIQYISHLDQSRFFQRQGELKASTLEARSAIEMQPDRIEPYLLIINNLLTAGDARNAERQLDQLLSNVDEQSINQQNLNDAALIRAEANLMQQEFDDALAALEELKEPDRVQQLEGALIQGDIHLAAGHLDAARDAYSAARNVDSGEAEPLIGLSKVAYSQNETEQGNEYITQAEELDPDNEELWLWKARLANSNGDWAAAEQAYINALETVGQYDVMTYQKFETMSALINVLREQGKSSEAFVYEEILAKSAPGTLKSSLVAAQEAFNNGELNNAARYLEEALAQAPGHPQASLMLGIVRFRQGRSEDAEALLSPVANMEDSEQARKLLAATRLRMRDPKGAKEILANLEDQDSDPETLALVGIASLVSGDSESGEQFIERSLKLAPDNASLRLRYSAYLIRRGHTDRAIEQADRVLENNPESEQARLQIIQAYVSAKEYDDAIATASEWVTEQPQSVSALVTRGNVAIHAGNHGEARQFYQRAVDANSEDPSPLNALANLAQSQGETDKAKEYYRRAIELSPDNSRILQGLSSVMKREELNALMEEIREKQPNAYGPRLVLLESALIEGNTQQADELTASLLERKDETNPAPAESVVADIYHGIATQLAQRERMERATDVLRRGRVLFPENEKIGIQAASIEFSQGNPKEARGILRDVKQQHPDSAAPFHVEARYFEQQEEFQEAADLYQLALELEQTAELELARASALARSEQPGQAIESLENARQSFPRNPQILMNLALLQQKNEMPEKAIPLYEELLSISPRNVIALNNLAWIYQQKGDDRAMELARQAFEEKSDNAAIADTYGWILFKAGQHEESVPILEKAHAAAPQSGEIGSHLAEAYKSVGRQDKAKAILERVQ